LARSKEKGVDTITCSTYSSSAGEDTEGTGGARHYFWSWVQNLLTLVLLMVVLSVVVMTAFNDGTT
jgi:hypothetical protein